MIELVNYDLKIGDKLLLPNINLKINDGDIILLTGANGSGKSVLLRLLSRLNKDEKIIDTFESRGVVIEKSKLLPHMTGREFLNFLNELNSDTAKSNKERSEELIKYFKVEKYSNQKIKEYSLGTTHKYALIQAFMHNPELLLLDEPTDSLDTESIELLYNLINAQIDKGKTIIIVAHNDEEIKQRIEFTRYLKIEGETLVETT